MRGLTSLIIDIKPIIRDVVSEPHIRALSCYERYVGGNIFNLNLMMCASINMDKSNKLYTRHHKYPNMVLLETFQMSYRARSYCFIGHASESFLNAV